MLQWLVARDHEENLLYKNIYLYISICRQGEPFSCMASCDVRYYVSPPELLRYATENTMFLHGLYYVSPPFLKR